MNVKNGIARSVSFSMIPKMRSVWACRSGQNSLISLEKIDSSTPTTKNSNPPAASVNATG